MPRWRTFLPRIAQPHALAGQSDADSPLAVFTAAWLALLGDRASLMRYDARLAQAAQAQADWLAANDFADDPHVGANGSTANERVRASGYTLPSYWPVRGNQCESVTRSWDAPDEAARDLASHAAHHDHVLGLGWYAEHTQYGVGQAQTYYVLVTAPIEGSE